MKKLPEIISIFLIQLSNGTENGKKNNGGLGNNRKLLYSRKEVPGDMERFVEFSGDGTMIVGPTTYDGFFKKPLPGRNTIVVSRKYSDEIKKIQDGLYHINDFYNAIAAARQLFPDKKIIIGGGVPIYELGIPFSDKLVITEVFGEKDADRKLNFSKGPFKEIERIHNEHEGLKYDYVLMEKIIPINPEHDGDHS